jgi:hypothetical protein
LERLFGFEGDVELTLQTPDSAKGLVAEKLTLSKEKGEGKLEVSAAGDATAGGHQCTLRARGRFNNVQVESSTSVSIVVEQE